MYEEFFAMIKKNKPNNTIIIDGVVGVGKTSLMSLLHEEFGFEEFIEPVVDNPLLDKFYHDRTRYSFPLQIFFLNRRFRMLKEAEAMDNYTLMDRSIYGDVIFAKLLNENKEMADDEFALYVDLLTNMLDHIEAPRLMIYLKTSTEHAISRIQKRGRDYEQIVEYDYWNDLNREYTAYFDSYNLSPLLVIDAEKYDYVNNEDDKNAVIELVKQHIDTLK